jgi:hypothetical protein
MTTPAELRTEALHRLVTDINDRCRILASILRRQGPGWAVDPEADAAWWHSDAHRTITETFTGDCPDYYEDPDGYAAWQKAKNSALRKAKQKATAKREMNSLDWADVADRFRRIAREAQDLASFADYAARQVPR